MKKILPILFAIVIAIGCFLYAEPTQPQTAPENVLQVHFLDVGQADCALVLFEEDAMLIDAGNNDDADTILDYLDAYGVQQLKYVVGTHPHEDHIGALDAVLYAVEAENLLMPRAQTNAKTFEDVLDAALAKNLTITAPQAGDTYPLGDAEVTVVSNYVGDDLNNVSIMLRVTYGSTAFLFTGDAEKDAEFAALQTGLALDCDVLKVGHHGSSTSTSAEFLAAASPAYAVISCGAGNDYGHPHTETLDILTNCTVYRTDLHGTVMAQSDGSGIEWYGSGSLQTSYVLNLGSGKFHLTNCDGAAEISAANRKESNDSRQTLISAGYSPCGNCRP